MTVLMILCSIQVRTIVPMHELLTHTAIDHEATATFMMCAQSPTCGSWNHWSSKEVLVR